MVDKLKDNWKHTEILRGERHKEVLILIKSSRYFRFDQGASDRIMGYPELEGISHDIPYI